MTRIFRSSPRLTWFLALTLVFQLTPSLHAQRRSAGRNSNSVLAAFKDVVARPSQSTVRVLCDGAEAALGTIVSPDGFIITKASDLKNKIVCTLKDGKQFPARIVGVEEKYDLALLKIDTSGLKPIDWRTEKSEVGDWVASAGNSADPVAIGVVSVNARSPNPFEMGPVGPPANSGFLGIRLREEEDGPVIDDVTKGSAAEKAGLKKGDMVLSVAGKRMASAERLIAAIQRYKAGEVVSMKVRRGEEEKELKAKLGSRPSSLFSRGDRMNQMGGELSRKRTGFPVILQHDTFIKPKDCGGPLVDLDGKAIGINIARAGRTETYAIPAERVVALLPELKSGKLAPKEEADDSRMLELESTLKKLRSDLKKGEKALGAITGDEEEDDLAKKELQKKLTELRKKIDETQKTLDEIRKDPTKK